MRSETSINFKIIYHRIDKIMYITFILINSIEKPLAVDLLHHGLSAWKKKSPVQNVKNETNSAQNSAQNKVFLPFVTGINGFQCKWNINDTIQIIIPARACVSAPKETRNTEAPKTAHFRMLMTLSQ